MKASGAMRAARFDAEQARGAGPGRRSARRKELAMRYRNLGRSGLIVSELCLGTMTFGGGEGMWQVVGKLQQDEADALVRQSLDAGINFFDTANVYSEGQSETILGQSLKNLGVARD